MTTQPNPQVKNMKAQNEADARKKIQMIANRLDSGEDFATVAMTYSEQPETSQNGGDLGFMPESSLKTDKIAYEAITKLKPGQYTGVLVVADPQSHQIYGYRVVKLLSREVIWPARTERSAGATGHPGTVARPPGAVAEGGVLRVGPRQVHGGQLLRGRHPEESRNHEVGEPGGVAPAAEVKAVRPFYLVDGQRYSMIARVSPALTAAPSATRIFCTLPSLGDFISFCIFMASMTMMPWPAFTSSFYATRMRTILPGMGALIFCGPASLPAMARRVRRERGSLHVDGIAGAADDHVQLALQASARA